MGSRGAGSAAWPSQAEHGLRQQAALAAAGGKRPDQVPSEAVACASGGRAGPAPGWAYETIPLRVSFAPRSSAKPIAVGQGLPKTPTPAEQQHSALSRHMRALLLSAVYAGAMALSHPKPALSTAPLVVPHKLLMGPGPSTANPRVLACGSLPMVRKGQRHTLKGCALC